jgi:multiple sugar transport system permease protein
MISLSILGVWKSAGYYAILFLAALQDVPDVFYEAAEIDGATSWQKFQFITLPLISPAILFVAIIAVIGSFQVFDQVYLLTNGGPGTATYFYNLHLFSTAFRYFRMGSGAAMAYVLFAILFAVTYLQFRLGRQRAAQSFDFV